MLEENLKKKFKELEGHILELGIKYIEPHRNPLETPEDYNLDVHSFCILCHAAFEEFLEDVTLYSVGTIENEFKAKARKISYATICFLHFDKNMFSFAEKKWDSSNTLNEYLESRLEARKSELSNYATQYNHGIDVKYLIKLLLPIGIDIPYDVNQLNSLEKLKNVRGTFAHSYARKTNPMAPEDAESVVFDVLEMVENIKDKALNMSYYLV